MNAVPGGGMAPNPDFVRTVEETFPDKQFEFIVGCQAGKRSAMAVEALKNAGYENMCNFEGGFQAWYAEGMQVER
jgi:rhodanese-related sulfurtransferase